MFGIGYDQTWGRIKNLTSSQQKEQYVTRKNVTVKWEEGATKGVAIGLDTGNHKSTLQKGLEIRNFVYEEFHFNVSQFSECDIGQCQHKTALFQLHCLYNLERGGNLI
jgi:hypothetical protein